MKKAVLCTSSTGVFLFGICSVYYFMLHNFDRDGGGLSSHCWQTGATGSELCFQSINQSNFYSANIPGKARLSGATAKSVFNSEIEETVPDLFSNIVFRGKDYYLFFHNWLSCLWSSVEQNSIVLLWLQICHLCRVWVDQSEVVQLCFTQCKSIHESVKFL